jgi:glycosyltransferase involved in cell wall biosynthesis
MITIVCSSQEPSEKFKTHLIKTCGLGDKNIEILHYENKGTHSLTELYNKALKEAKYDVITFLHHDITINSKQWGNKVIKHFRDNEEYGIIGVAGSKLMTDSARWWDNPDRMYGRVSHTHEGRTWESKYSKDLGNRLEPVVLVDGVFFSVRRDRLKKGFDETVDGFHFYDVTFCLDNYLAGVKIGVHTNIKILHQSIGMTNDAWEEKRVLMTERYKDAFPIKADRVFDEHTKLKVLLACLNFRGYTGSELYVYELAKSLKKKGHDVSVVSNIGGPITDKARRLGIKVFNIEEPPTFRRGDGLWQLPTQDGSMVASNPNTLYKVAVTDFDIMHLNHTPITKRMLELYPEVPAISSIHSEVIDLEYPVISEKIGKYIAIRPEIKDFLINTFNIPEEKIDVVYNPIDNTRFNTDYRYQPTNGVKKIVFVGTIDYLRRNAIEDLVKTTKEEGNRLILVGNNSDTYLEGILRENEHITYYSAIPNVETIVKQCDETAGILLGRTTIEGWLCGKGGWIYDVDSGGNIISKSFHDVPEDVDKFRVDNVVEEVLKEYEDVLR